VQPDLQLDPAAADPQEGRSGRDPARRVPWRVGGALVATLLTGTWLVAQGTDQSSATVQHRPGQSASAVNQLRRADAQAASTNTDAATTAEAINQLRRADARAVAGTKAEVATAAETINRFRRAGG